MTTGNSGALNGPGGARVVASYRSYREAERAVDRLADARFPVERVTIVGRDLRFVEQVSGRTGYVDRTLRGTVAGGLTGLVIGWLFAVFNWFDPTVAWGWLIFDGLWFGMLVGALLGLLGHALTQGRRDFTALPTLRAGHYDVLVDEEVAEEAARILLDAQLVTGEPEPAL